MRPMQKRIEKLLEEKAAEIDNIEVKADLIERNQFPDLKESSSEESEHKSLQQDISTDPNCTVTTGTIPLGMHAK
jgi:hypothetical protein